MLRMDEMPGECNHKRMKEGKELFKLEDRVLAQEVVILLVGVVGTDMLIRCGVGFGFFLLEKDPAMLIFLFRNLM